MHANIHVYKQGIKGDQWIEKAAYSIHIYMVIRRIKQKEIDAYSNSGLPDKNQIE